MEGFKDFLSDTAGIHLLNFWLDCEYFKDAMENFDEIINMDIRNRLFRWVAFISADKDNKHGEKQKKISIDYQRAEILITNRIELCLNEISKTGMI